MRDRLGFVRLGSERLQAVVGERNGWGFGEFLNISLCLLLILTFWFSRIGLVPLSFLLSLFIHSLVKF